MAKRPNITENTRKNLADAFWKLYQTKPLERISVKEITDLAGYNRGTFYLYFRDIYDVLDSIEREVLSFVESEVERYRCHFHSTSQQPDVSEITNVAIEICKACDFKLLILLNDKFCSNFEERIRESMRRQLLNRIEGKIEMDDCLKEYTIHFFISGVLGVLKKWYNDGMVIPVEEHLAAVCNVLYGPKNIMSCEGFANNERNN